MPAYVATFTGSTGATTKTVEGASYKEAYKLAKGMCEKGVKLTDFRAEGSAPRTPRPRKAKAEAPAAPAPAAKVEPVKPATVYKPVDDGKRWDCCAAEFKTEEEALDFARSQKGNVIGAPYRGALCYRVAYWREMTEEEYQNRWKAKNA